MRNALLINPAKEDRQWEVDARKLGEADVSNYKVLGLIFVCKCRTPDNLPEMEWRHGYLGTGGKWFNKHFAAVAGTAASHKADCAVRVNRREKTDLPSLPPNIAFERGYPSIFYLNVRSKGHVPYRFERHRDLTERYDGLRLTRSAPSLEEERASVQNRFVAAPIGSMSEFIKWSEKVVARQEGSLASVLISHGGGVRSLPGSFFLPSDQGRRSRMTSEAARAWTAIGYLQEEARKDRKSKGLPTRLALHPIFMRIIPGHQQQAVEDFRQVTGKRWVVGDRGLLVRGTGGPTGRVPAALTHDVVCPDISTKRVIDKGVAEGQLIYGFVTPVVERLPGQKQLPNALNIKMHIMSPDMVHIGPLPPTIERALNEPYQRGDWRRGLKEQDARQTPVRQQWALSPA